LAGSTDPVCGDIGHGGGRGGGSSRQQERQEENPSEQAGYQGFETRKGNLPDTIKAVHLDILLKSTMEQESFSSISL
jgi:hypothetical protein